VVRTERIAIERGIVSDATNITRLTRIVAPLRDDNDFSNVSLAAVDGRIREQSRRFRRIASADVLRIPTHPVFA
jgi:hypothetical protein